jgi:acyl transferase domain-containing protein/NADPH:quinone reductase-like Zn-dependent oxidoreductase
MPPYPFISGFEAAGTVVKAGKKVSRVRVGDDVIVLMDSRMGGHSFIITADEGLVVKKPQNVSFKDACAFPVVFLTVQNIFERANIQKGEKILIQTAAGGIGLVAVQYALKKGAVIFATAGSREKLAYLADMGVKHCINYREEDFEKEILKLTDGYGVDVVINTLPGEAIQKGLNILAPGGRYFEIAITGLKASCKFDLSNLVTNQSFHSFNLRKVMANKPEEVTRYLDVMANELEKGNVRPVIGKVFPFSQIKQAYKYMEGRHNIGKIVVTTPVDDLAFKERLEKAVQHSGNGGKDAPCTNGQLTCDIAVIGISGRFPQAANVEEFWQNLASGKCSVTEVPKNRWDPDLYYDPDVRKLDKTNSKWGGFLDNIDKFDPLFFNISAKEAVQSDPQQRMFLEESWSALEDAGYATDEISNMCCSVFVGVGDGDYINLMEETGFLKDAQAFWGNANSVLAARISYYLNLKGPAVAVDTACSSSLVALHMACQGIWQGECEMAIAGGVFACATPNFVIASSNGGMLSPTGICSAFDNKADGFVPGEGVGALVLKRLDSAIKDGDHIYGVIKGSGINQDGKTNGITAPSTLSQSQLEQYVYDRFGINPRTISFVEAHGTGTKLGDPIEIEALTSAYRKFTDEKQFCAIGSVKTNMGHAATAAGVSSVIKVLMSFKYGKIPPSLNFTKANEHIDFENSPFYVNTELKDWVPDGDFPRRATVSSFGFSGTNAHILLEEPPIRESEDSRSIRPYWLIPVSAKTETALKQKIKDMVDWMEREGKNREICDISFTLGAGRRHFPVRAAFVVKDTYELAERFKSAAANGDYGKYYNSGDFGIPDAALQQVCSKLSVELGENTEDNEYYKKLEYMAELYTKGCTPGWKTIYRGVDCRRISMPTYPFERDSYWIPTDRNGVARAAAKPAVLHPLVGVNTSTLKEQSYTTLLEGDEFFVADHVISGRRMLPGVAYLEMACAAAGFAGETVVKKIRNVLLARPVVLDNGPCTVHIGLYPVSDGVDFEIASRGVDGSDVVHAQGKVVYSKEDTVQPELRDIDGIIARCSNVMGKDKCYKWFESIGFKYGPSFKVIQELRKGEGEALSFLKLPEQVKEGFDRFILHPSLMDGMLQTVLGTLEDTGEQYLPFGMDEIEIKAPLTGECCVYAAISREDEAAGSELKKFDMSLMKKNGQILVKIKGFSARMVKGTNEVPGNSEDIYMKNLLKKLESGEIGIDEVRQFMGVTK